jgi:hypothetical protein
VRLHGLQPGEIIRRHALEEGFCTGATHGQSSHMTDIEEPRPAADSLVLIHHTGVVDGHLPSCEINELRPGDAMLGDEGSVLHGRATLPRAIQRRKSELRWVE